FQRIVVVPTVMGQQLRCFAVATTSRCTCSAGILPLRFRGQPVAGQTQVVRLQLHVRKFPGHDAAWLVGNLVNTLIFGDSLLLTEPVAVRCRFVPLHASNGTRRRPIAPELALREAGLKSQELLLGHRRCGQRKCPADSLLVLSLDTTSIL